MVFILVLLKQFQCTLIKHNGFYFDIFISVDHINSHHTFKSLLEFTWSLSPPNSSSFYFIVSFNWPNAFHWDAYRACMEDYLQDHGCITILPILKKISLLPISNHYRPSRKSRVLLIPSPMTCTFNMKKIVCQKKKWPHRSERQDFKDHRVKQTKYQHKNWSLESICSSPIPLQKNQTSTALLFLPWETGFHQGMKIPEFIGSRIRLLASICTCWVILPALFFK